MKHSQYQDINHLNVDLQAQEVLLSTNMFPSNAPVNLTLNTRFQL